MGVGEVAVSAAKGTADIVAPGVVNILTAPFAPRHVATREEVEASNYAVLHPIDTARKGVAAAVRGIKDADSFALGQGTGVVVGAGALLTAGGAKSESALMSRVRDPLQFGSMFEQVVGESLTEFAVETSNGQNVAAVFGDVESAAVADFVKAPALTSKAPLFARSSFRKSTHEAAKEVARDASGKMICETCGDDIPDKISIETKNGPVQRVGYDLDHYPKTWAGRVRNFVEQRVPPTRAEVLEEYNKDVRALCPSCNVSHKWEGVPGPFRPKVDGAKAKGD